MLDVMELASEANWNAVTQKWEHKEPAIVVAQAVPQRPQHNHLSRFKYHILVVPEGWSNDPIHLEGFLDNDLKEKHPETYADVDLIPILVGTDVDCLGVYFFKSDGELYFWRSKKGPLMCVGVWLGLKDTLNDLQCDGELRASIPGIFGLA